jgi:F-type H+-transporting ATPase subunit b
MPQFDASVALPQIAWLVLVFGLLYAVVRTMLPKVEAVTETRSRTIGDNLAAAEAAKSAADTAGSAYEAGLAKAREDALGVVGEAKSAAARATEARLAEVGEALDARLADAAARIASARGNALGQIDAVAADAAADIVQKLTGRRPGDAEVKAALALA